MDKKNIVRIVNDLADHNMPYRILWSIFMFGKSMTISKEDMEHDLQKFLEKYPDIEEVPTLDGVDMEGKKYGIKEGLLAYINEKPSRYKYAHGTIDTWKFYLVLDEIEKEYHTWHKKTEIYIE